jgi:hypothetical protein
LAGVDSALGRGSQQEGGDDHWSGLRCIRIRYRQSEEG